MFAPVLFVIAVSVVSSALSLLYVCMCMYVLLLLFFFWTSFCSLFFELFRPLDEVCKYI